LSEGSSRPGWRGRDLAWRGSPPGSRSGGGSDSSVGYRGGRLSSAERLSEADLEVLRAILTKARFVAFDFETTGLDAASDRVVEIGAVAFGLAERGGTWELVPGGPTGQPAPAGPAVRPSAGATPSQGAAPPVQGELFGPGGEAAPGAMPGPAQSDSPAPGASAALARPSEFCTLVNPGRPIPAQASAVHGISDLDVSFAPSFAEAGRGLLTFIEGAVIVAHNAPFDLGFLRAECERTGLPVPRNLSYDTRILAKTAVPGLPSYALGKLAASFGIAQKEAHRGADDARVCMELFGRCIATLFK
jgi:DNA polymerase III epsilon subunit-like protein